jgi:acyl carrier protein
VNVPSASEVQDFILRRLGDPLHAKGLLSSPVPETFDLLLEGVIDSFGVVELVGTLEEQYGIEFDFDELEADEMTQIGPLSKYVAAKLNGR